VRAQATRAARCARAPHAQCIEHTRALRGARTKDPLPPPPARRARAARAVQCDRAIATHTHPHTAKGPRARVGANRQCLITGFDRAPLYRKRWRAWCD
jgi:hypothetical protein